MQYFKREYNILIIEDNLGEFQLIKKLLFEKIENSIVSNAYTFKAAEELLTRDDHTIDVIILDLSLSDMGGVPLMKRIVDISGQCPVIVLTGHSDFNYAVQSQSLGISDYLLKEGLTASLLCKSVIYSFEQKITRCALEQSERNYYQIFHLSPLPMWVIDSNTFSFLDVNEAAIKNYGYDRDEFLSMTIHDISSSTDTSVLEENLNALKTGQLAGHNGIFRHTTKNNQDIQVHIRSNSIEYKGRRAIVIIVNDIRPMQNYA